MPLKDRDEKNGRPFGENGSCRLVFGIKAVFGVGVTFTRSFRPVNLDEDWEAQWDIQCDGRPVRLSQKNKRKDIQLPSSA